MRILTTVAVLLLVPSLAFAHITSNSASDSNSISGAQTGPATATLNYSVTSNTPSSETIHNNVQAPDIVTSGANLCALPVGASMAFLGGGGGVAFSHLDSGCSHRADAAAWWVMGQRAMAYAMMCMTADDRKASASVPSNPCNTNSNGNSLASRKTATAAMLAAPAPVAVAQTTSAPAIPEILILRPKSDTTDALNQASLTASRN